jgi:hypothetical protein
MGGASKTVRQSVSLLPAGVRAHLIDRMHDRSMSIADLNQLRLWTFLLRGQAAQGHAL